ncbi:sterile alpha motif domain-containing protein 9-like isoform 1-T5 [Menidia menidia]
MADQGETKEGELPPDIKDWSKHQVRQWALGLKGVDASVADLLLEQDISGPILLHLDTEKLKQIGLTYGPAFHLIHARDERETFQKEEPTRPTNQPGKPCKPYPFCRYHDTLCYVEDSVVDVTESGASDWIEPCHEYKAFINTTDETKFVKFTAEVIRFAASCMNSRTNGTIHFGIGDRPDFIHGQVLGVVAEDREAYAKELTSAINACFEYKHQQAAQMCIKPPRFVEVLKKNSTSSDKCVIEVDIVPESSICLENFYHTQSKKKNKKKPKEAGPSRCFFVRDGGSSRDLLTDGSEKEYHQFVESTAQRSQLRRSAEEKHLAVVRSSTQGSKLIQMITGGSASLDKSGFERYVIVTDKTHPSHFESVEFLIELNPTAVLDFDPESAKHGLYQYFDHLSTVTPHLPARYKITEGVEDIANKLKLTRNTSWVFCNGGIEGEAPSECDEWLIEKGASVRDVISFLCRKDVLPNKKFLVIFLLLSAVRERMDPLVETFCTFWQELQGKEQILCVFDSEKAFTSWRVLIKARCRIDIDDRCVYELSFAEVNGTILSLWSKNRRDIRFLPCGGESKVGLDKKVERRMNTLEILCVNQCDGGVEDRITIEKNFYKGGKVSWWNFYFSEQPGSMPFIKRDKFHYIRDTVLPDLRSLTKACVLLSLLHAPGCGGTTLAMHLLWDLRHSYRCAVLKSSSSDPGEIAEQVVVLLRHPHKEEIPKIPVLLMIDDFNDMEKVLDLVQLIEKECAKTDVQSSGVQVIVLNCMRTECSELTQPTAETVFIGNDLSEKEQKMFAEKLVEIEKIHKNAETFYGFMIMKANFNQEYIEGVVRNTLRSFNINQKHAQLLVVLVLLNVYCKDSCLSVSLCEDFLDLRPRPVCGTIKIEDGFGNFSSFIVTCTVEGNVVFQAVKMIHSKIARQCLKELTTTHNATKAEITDLLLTTDQLYESTQGQGKLKQDVHRILVKRNYSAEEESQFSPLIQEIACDTPGLEEMVLKNASKRFDKDAIISQLLARYYYLKKKDFSEARNWAEKAKGLSRDSSYIADTSAQVLKHELKNAIAYCRAEPVSSDKLSYFLKMAQSAIEAFRQTQDLAKKESIQRLSTKTDNSPFNTAGCLGEIQVGVLIIDLLENTPVFSSGDVRHDLMAQVLSGEVRFQDIEKNDPRRSKNRAYYDTLKQHEGILYDLKCRMKLNIDYLEKLYVNLGPRFRVQDCREQVAQNELFRCFRRYAKVFLQSAVLSKNKMLGERMRVLQIRQFLEKENADTYSGILKCLSSKIPTEKIEKIVTQYQLICQPNHEPTVKHRTNFIYANVVLSHIKLESRQLLPYPQLQKALNELLAMQIPLSDSLPVHYIAVVLLWTDCRTPGTLGTFISQMKSSYHEEMREVYNGKTPIMHFLLGKKRGYERLVHIGQIRGLVAEQEQFDAMWRNGKIWKERKVCELLLRVTGEVNGDGILVNIQDDYRVKVAPTYRSQISGCAGGSRVSFFIGFSMKGPIALDIEPLR